MKKYINARIFKETASKLEKLFGKETTGVAFAAEIYTPLSYQMLKDVKGVFSEKELKAMIDNHNGTMPDFQFMGKQFLVAHCQDGDTYEGMAEKWEIDINDLVSKIENCSNAGIFYFHSEIFRFWNDKAAYNQNLELFVKTFSI
ncbi:MAG: hypothetical protein N4A59_06185 [Marinifilum sp.]|jgi:hypothetical protein|nr:hypothetical protein [Marinifilum sp.]